MVIEQADRVDQVRLHRIIGFMSRAHSWNGGGGEPAAPADAFLVVGEMAEPNAAARIDRVVSAPNGFQLTEALVQLRGMDGSVAPGAATAATATWFDPDQDWSCCWPPGRRRTGSCGQTRSSVEGATPSWDASCAPAGAGCSPRSPRRACARSGEGAPRRPANVGGVGGVGGDHPLITRSSPGVYDAQALA